MPDQSQITQRDLDLHGQEIVASLDRTSPTTATISWTLPTDAPEYDGILVLVKTSPITPDNYPVDGIRYTPSADLTAPNNTIGDAQVVGAYYGDKITTSTNIIGLDQTQVYFASVHMVSNTLQYFTKGRQAYPVQQRGDAYSGSIPAASSPPLAPSLGQVYYNNQTGIVSMWAGAAWVPAGVGPTLTGGSWPPVIATGQFFYHTGLSKLFVWNGTSFTQANTADEGIPMYNKMVGDDQTYDERAHLLKIIKAQMGYPAICVELNEDQFDIAMDNAIQEFRRRCDNAYKKRYFSVPIAKGQGLLYLNDPVVGTDKVVDVIKIWRTTGLGLVAQGENGIYGQSFLTQMFAPGVVDLTSIYMLNAYAEQFSQIFAGEVGFGWDEAKRELRLFRLLGANEKVLIECVAERTEQEIFVDRYAQQWIQGWTVSEVKMMLGHIRSKYGNLPGAGGGITLNGSELLASAEQDQTELLRQIMDFEVGNGGGEFGAYSVCIG
jgi:hypothetical protein